MPVAAKGRPGESGRFGNYNDPKPRPAQPLPDRTVRGRRFAPSATLQKNKPPGTGIPGGPSCRRRPFPRTAGRASERTTPFSQLFRNARLFGFCRAPHAPARTGCTAPFAPPARRAQKNAGTECSIPYTTPTRHARKAGFTKTTERGIITLQMRGESRCVWRSGLRMQGAGWLHTLSLPLQFLCALQLYYKPIFSRFQLQL